METRDAIMQRRSYRAFTDTDIPYEKVEELINYGTWAPSSCNRQLWNFIVLSKKDLRKHPDVFHHVNKINANWAVIVTYHKTYNSQFYANIQSGAGAIMNMVLMATDMGIGSIWMAERGNEIKLRKFLRIPDSELMVATVCLGEKTDEKIFPPARRPLADVIHRGSFRRRPLWPDSTDPTKWTYGEMVNCIDYCMRAKSPSKLFYLANQKLEYAKLVKDFPKLEGSVFMPYDFSGELAVDLFHKNKFTDLTIHSISKNIREFILERAVNEGLDKDFAWDEGITPTKKVYDNIIVFKRLEKLPDPLKAWKHLIANNTKSGTRIILVLEPKYNLQNFVKGIFRFIREIGFKVKRPFQQVEPVGLFGPFEQLSYKSQRKLLAHPKLKVVSDYGLDIMPGIRANAGFPFWGRKIVPSTKFEEWTTRGFLKHFCRTRIIELKVK